MTGVFVLGIAQNKDKNQHSDFKVISTVILL